MGDVVVVAGAGGFIGQHLSQALAEQGLEVIGLDAKPAVVPNGYCKQVDLTEREAVIAALRSVRPRWVFNLTGVIDHTIRWPEQRTVMEQHWLSVINLVEALQDQPPEAFVNVGSSDEYGDQPSPQHEGLREMPVAPYSAAKVAATHYLQMWHRRTGFPAIIARFFLVYGPGQGVERLIPWACVTLARGETMPATEGLQQRDFLYVEDAVRGLIALASTPTTRGEIFNVASGCPMTVRAVLETIENLIGRGKLEFGARPMRPGEIMALYADVSKIQRFTGWQSAVELSEGLRRTIDFYIKKLSDMSG